MNFGLKFEILILHFEFHFTCFMYFYGSIYIFMCILMYVLKMCTKSYLSRQLFQQPDDLGFHKPRSRPARLGGVHPSYCLIPWGNVKSK